MVWLCLCRSAGVHRRPRWKQTKAGREWTNECRCKRHSFLTVTHSATAMCAICRERPTTHRAHSDPQAHHRTHGCQPMGHGNQLLTAAHQQTERQCPATRTGRCPALRLLGRH